METTTTTTKPAPRRKRKRAVEPYTALGNARRLMMFYGEHIAWCKAWDSWVIWDGRRWKIDENLTMDKWCVDIISEMRDTGRKIRIEKNKSKEDQEFGEAMESWASRCENPAAVKAMQMLARHMCSTTPAAFDTDKWVVNCPNGVLDLKTGKLYHPHDPIRMLTKMTAAGPSSKYKPERWLKFLDWLWDGDPEMIGFVQRAAGLSLSGSVDPQVWFFLHGSGENGKSTLVNTLRDVLGDYGCQAQDDVFSENRRDSHPTSVAMLRGRRLVTVTECPSDKAFNTSLLNSITGGDPLTARYCAKDPFEFHPECKIWLSANDQPTIRTSRHGTWRRIMTIPFTKRVTKREDHLDIKLKNEASGILNWMLEGCMQYHERGIDPPAMVREATDQYRKTQDYVGAFMTDCCLTGDPDDETPYLSKQSDVYQQYRSWTEDVGCKTMTKISFGKELMMRGYKKDKKCDARYWRGIALTRIWNA